ncbi:MAG: hypothetical protein LBS50_00045 [Prevotellaceae bacterium]|jgi:hypothetical protein|nr:hypothetical protein [Prevotellaceae bacterium]
MKKYTIIIALIFSVISSNINAQQEEIKYRRSSLYSVLISHPFQKFHEEIDSVFLKIPIPEKYNNHDLSVKIVSSDQKRQEKEEIIKQFIDRNQIARRLVARWFERDPELGYFFLDLIKDRGLYDATVTDVNIAKMSARGIAQLEDAGEELIGNTFMLVNDIKYIDKSEGAAAGGTALRIFGAILGAATGSDALSNVTDLAASIVESIKGFKVTVTSYLYQLEWNEEVAATLYDSYYITEQDFDAAKKKAFDADSNLFKMKYVGKQVVNSGTTSVMGVNLDTPSAMIRKACERSIDKSIVYLQRTYDEFKVKTPLYSTEQTIEAKIGLKEGVTANSKYEVLQQVINIKNGNEKTEYKRVGIIKPIPNKIWDNRYMAIEEKAENANLDGTEFKKISGSDFQVGMLIREIK